MKKYSLIIVLFVLGLTNSFGQEMGSWKGILNVQGDELEVIFNLKEVNNELASTMDIPSQGALGLPMDKTVLTNNNLEINFAQAGITYKGIFKDEKFTGTYYQGGLELPLQLEKVTKTGLDAKDLESSEAQLKAIADLDKGSYKYSVEDFMETPNESSFQYSPNGTYLSYMKIDNSGKNHLYTKNTLNGSVTKVLEEKEQLIKGYSWINDSRILYAMDKNGDEKTHIYAVNLDGTNNVDLTPYEGVTAGILNALPEQEDYIIAMMNKDNPSYFEPYKINVNTGTFEKLYTNTDSSSPISNYLFDKDGVMRGYIKYINQGLSYQYYYKPAGSNDYSILVESESEHSFGILYFNYASVNPDEAYVMTNLDSDKIRIVLYDLKKKEILKELFSNADYDVSGLVLDDKRNFEIAAFGYNGEKGETVPVSKYYKKLHTKWTKLFKGSKFNVVGITKDESKYMLFVSSDKNAGQYYEYNSKSGKVSLLYDLKPKLAPTDMAEQRPITFKSRDGLTIRGYITLPKKALDGKKVPLIVNPHGGPQGIRDSWGFNSEAQLFASRGYATLQVNFRISGGYGKAFFEAGYNQCGRKIMDDIEDGVKYVIEQGWVDKENIAIYGASHGGYATLMGLIKTPELYKCGVDYVGISNIETFFKSFPPHWSGQKKMAYKYWYNLEDEKELAIAKQVSPINNVDKITKPLFVIQGANDPRVNINESNQIVQAVRAKGFEVPYMVKYNEGHGFSRQENRIELYNVMLGFFASNLK
ncbi:S9 family peptidase [Flavobacterium antarcticum]|uniref:S9 family peptidase n=1 Tax=Flavobacterium antarcticum TaxID=271155 RepID=UPI0003B4658D|nr:S9 family peptidase [Flavobacterium antarcticum]